MAVTPVPTELIQLSPFELGIAWSDGHQSRYQVRNIRLNCHCANCVDEWTREKRVSEESIPKDIRPSKIESVGRYALNIIWSDGHSTGIYTFEQLRSLCECGVCRAQ
jgi:DUF971 family protein